MKFFKKLNMVGAAHIIVPMLVMVGAGLAGSYFLVASHAATVTNYIQCTASGSKYYCNFSIPAPVETSAGGSAGKFTANESNYIYCQAQGGKVTKGSYYNTWWGYTVSDSGLKGWVNGVYAHTGQNNYGYSYLKSGKWTPVPTCPASDGHAPGGSTAAAPAAASTAPVKATCNKGWYTVGSGGGKTYYNCSGGKWVLTTCAAGETAVPSTSNVGPCVKSTPPVATACKTVTITGGKECQATGAVTCNTGYYATYNGSSLTCQSTAPVLLSSSICWLFSPSEGIQNGFATGCSTFSAYNGTKVWTDAAYTSTITCKKLSTTYAGYPECQT